MHKPFGNYPINRLRLAWEQAGIASTLVYYFLKRAFDLVFACTLLILLAPVYTLIAALVMLDSPGSPFFIQERVGGKWVLRNGRIAWQRTTFACYKFRTMVANCDPELHKHYVRALIEDDQTRMAQLQGEDVSVRKLIHDPRITRIGKYLRKFSLDELPQFWNVLKGEMSVVGPRPAIPYEVELYKPWYLERFETKPGITGLCQVTARCSTDFETSIRIDIHYIQEQNFWNDMKIILKTPQAIFSRRGAY